MFNTAHTRGPIYTRVRSLSAPVALISALALAPVANASPVAKVRSHVRSADIALHSVSSAAASGNVDVPLGTLTSQLGAAARISANLAVHANTQGAEQTAAAALAMVAREEAKAEMKLTAEASAVSGAEQSEVANAAITVAQTREAGLGVLGHLAAQAKSKAKVEAHVLANELATLTTDGKALLINLSDVLGKIDANVSSDTSSSGDVAQLAATETADVKVDLGRVEGLVSLLESGVRTDMSALTKLTSEVEGQIQGATTADSGCQAIGGGLSLGISLSGNALSSADASALAVAPGATVTSTSTVSSHLINGASIAVDMTTPSGCPEIVMEDSHFGVVSIEGGVSGSAASQTSGSVKL
jgi:hypothetical protein